MDDDKAVDQLTEAFLVASKILRPGEWAEQTKTFKREWRKEGVALAKAIRAAGGEIVFWKPFQPGDIPLPINVETHCFPFNTVRYKDMSHWCILRGPEVKP